MDSANGKLQQSDVEVRVKEKNIERSLTIAFYNL